ncbi:glycosyltransferase [Pelobium sp.]|nr:glycosyltransferase [Pelobium sp.]MDA9555186.1 glycosyltransferase [Pelobium sp.]
MPVCYEQVSLLVTHYNRSASLKRLLSSFKDFGINFGQIVVSDDGSKQEHLSALKQLQSDYHFDLVTTEKNKGLGNNINKGQDVVKYPFTLYVQEDFVPQVGFQAGFSEALSIMQNDISIDIIRFYAYFKYPYLNHYNDAFSEMNFSNSISKMNHLKFYVYSDHPHLRRSNFFEKFNRYKEGVKGDITEFDMCLSFLKNKGKGLFKNDFKDMFEQMNSLEEPSTMQRKSWNDIDSWFWKRCRLCYLKFRVLKNTLQLTFYK